MKLIKLTAKNFMPYYGDMEIGFPSDPNRNVMIIFGDNMRGKTSLLNALRWTFYGNAVGRHARDIQLQDIVNKEAASIGDWSVETCVTFEVGPDVYELRRRATKKALIAKPTRPQDFEVVRSLRKNSMPMSDHLVDAEINAIAPEQTSRFFLFDGELLQEYESLLVEGSDQGRKIKDAIEQALGVPTLTRGRDDLQTIVKAAHKRQSKDAEKFESLRTQAMRSENLQMQIAAIEKDIEGLEQKHREKLAEKNAHDEFIEQFESIHKAKASLDAQVQEQWRIEKRQREVREERLVLVKDAWREIVRPKLALKREQLRDDLQKITQQTIAHAAANARIAQLESAIAHAVCDSCGQPLHEAQRAAAARELGALQASIQSMLVDHAAAQRSSSSIRDLDKLLRPGPASELAALDKEAARLSVSLTKTENEIETLRDQIKGHDTAEIARRRALRDGLLTLIGNIEANIAANSSKLSIAKKESAMIAMAIGATPDAAGTRSTVLVNIATALEKVFALSIDKLREDLKETVQRHASEAFKKLTTQEKYSGLRINSHYGLTILDERGEDVPVRSAGAEQIVALSLIDGLARSGRSAGPVVMDTPFGRLDLKHRANILSYLPTTANQLVLLVHEGEVRRDSDLAAISTRVSRVYEIKDVNPRHSIISEVTS
ncbi:MAG: AAA family ATPase [Comamonadaceae bacterium]|jgi:DNA sulfur modification protein DndD|nr:AAA family ATPase [Comamonadaceae bacterium]